MIPYDPKASADCLPIGDYDYELNSVEETVSKTSGAPMYIMTWCTEQRGKIWTLKDYVTERAFFKLKALAKAWGVLGEFEMGQFDPNQHVGKLVRLSVSVEEDAQFGDKNRIEKFAPASFEPPPSRQPGDQADDVPF